MSTKEDQDRKDTQLAHEFRLSLSTTPSQSSFRVLALLFYKEGENSSGQTSSQLPPWVAQKTKDGRSFIVGTNDEPGFMGGAICAERSAMVQLRFLPSFEITKVVICTDSLDPISPGILCREFLAGHDSVPWETQILCTGCVCINCERRDSDLFLVESGKTKTSSFLCDCENGGKHVIPTLDTTLKDLYTYPSPYSRLRASESVTLGETYAKEKQQENSTVRNEFDSLNDATKKLFELAIEEARSNASENHPIYFGAAVEFDNGEIVTSHQASALEYGCTLDSVSQLASHIKKGGVPKVIVQADQFGIAHGPFAPARAFLSENGYGDCQILLHDVPIHTVKDIGSWSLRFVKAKDLAPNAPDIFKQTYS